MNHAQIDILREKIVDSFAGGGGTSTGIELATGRVVDIAINHDPDAGTPGKAGEIQSGADLPAVCPAAGGVGICRKLAGAGGGRLWSAYHPEAVFPDRSAGWAAHCVAGAYPRPG